MRGKPSPAQMTALRLTRTWSERGTYMPDFVCARSFDACVRHGWLEYRSVDQGSPYNGYALTKKGDLLLKDRP